MTKMEETQKLHSLVAAYIARHPEESLRAMSVKFRISLSQLSKIAHKHGVCRSRSLVLTPELLAELNK